MIKTRLALLSTAATIGLAGLGSTVTAATGGTTSAAAGNVATAQATATATRPSGRPAIQEVTGTVADPDRRRRHLSGLGPPRPSGLGLAARRAPDRLPASA